MGISSVGVPEEGERIAWIDTLKGIGILCVVFGYAWQGVPRLVDFLCSFNFPLFFLVSGFLYDSGKYRGDYRRFLRSRARTLILPYFTFAAVSLLCWHCFGPGRGNHDLAGSLPRALLGMILANNYGKWPEINPALWFLPCLFVTENIFYFLDRRVRASRLPAALAVLALAGYACSLFLPYRIPWGAEIALTGTVFYGLGFLIRRKGRHASFSELSLSRSALGFLGLGVLLMHLLNGRVDLSENRLGHLPCFYLGALVSISLCALIAFRLERVGPLRFLGRNFLPILGLHLAVAPVAYAILSPGFHTSFAGFKYSIPLGALLASAQIALILPLIVMVRRGIPMHRIRIPAFHIPAIDRTAVFHIREERALGELPALRISGRAAGGEGTLTLRFQAGAPGAHPDGLRFDSRTERVLNEFPRAVRTSAPGEGEPSHDRYPENLRLREAVSSRVESPMV